MNTRPSSLIEIEDEPHVPKPAITPRLIKKDFPFQGAELFKDETELASQYSEGYEQRGLRSFPLRTLDSFSIYTADGALFPLHKLGA